MNGEGIYILVVETFHSQEPQQELILLLQTDLPSPHSLNVEEMKGIEMKKSIHFKQGNFHLKCRPESNPPQQQHFFPPQ